MLKFSEQEEKLLKEFYEKQHSGAKDNVGTRDAIHVVERVVKQFVPVPDEGNWYYDGKCYYSFDDLIDALREDTPDLPDYDDVKYEEVNGTEIWSRADYIKAFDITAYEGRIVESHQPVAFFFILDEAKRYKNDYQSHNCSNCRIYTYSLGYSNYGDLPVFREMLLKMGKELLGEEKMVNG